MEQSAPHPLASTTPEPVRTHEDVLALISDVERQIARLRSVQTVSAEELTRQHERARQLEARETAIHSAEALLTAREAQLRAMAETIQGERARLNARALELEERERALSEQAEAGAAERERVAAEMKRLAEEQSALASLREELAARESRCGDEVARQRELVLELQSKIDGAVAAANDAREEKNALERELRDAMEEARRAQESHATHARALETRLAEQGAELEATRQSLQIAGQKLASLAHTVAEHAPALERGAAAAALVAEQERKILELERRVEETRGAHEEHARLESSLADAQRRCTMLEATVTSLERKLGEAHELAESESRRAAELSAAKETQGDERARIERLLEEKSKRIAEMGGLLRTRKTRLDRAKQLRRERTISERGRSKQAAEAALVNALEEERVLKRQREELRHVQEMLAASERRQLGSAARSRGLFAAAWCMVVTAVVAASAWFAAGAVWPVPSVASVDLVAKVRDGERLSPEMDTTWQAVHRDALKDDAFRAAVQRRMSDRGLNALGGSREMNAWLDGVHVDSDGPGALRLIASGPDNDTVITALDTLATTLANESPRLLRARGDLPKAMIAAATAVPGRVTYSTIVPQTAPADRLQAAAMLFSGVAALGLAGGAVVYGRLARAKRKFEEVGAV